MSKAKQYKYNLIIKQILSILNGRIDPRCLKSLMAKEGSDITRSRCKALLHGGQHPNLSIATREEAELMIKISSQELPNTAGRYQSLLDARINEIRHEIHS